jgi:sigma-E factor negative regulatory protein RseA
MKDKIHEQLSALVDNELEDGEQELLLRQLARDEELSGRLLRYQVISDALQNHLPAKFSAGFHGRVLAALSDAPPVHRESSRLAVLVKPAAGLAIAASVAMVAVLSLQSIRQEGPEPVAALASTPSQDRYIRAAADHAVQSGAPAVAAQGLDVYLANHSEYAVNRGMLPYVHLVGHELKPDSKE